MKHQIVLLASLLSLAMIESGCVVTAGPPPPPAPIVEAEVPVPYPGAVWVGGAWVWHPGHRRYEWRHGYWRH
jgi:hypothetical protein